MYKPGVGNLWHAELKINVGRHTTFIQGSTTLGRPVTGTQGHKYVDIIGKLAHFIQKVVDPCDISCIPTHFTECCWTHNIIVL